MKVLQAAVPFIPGAMIVALSGCGGGGCSFTVPQAVIDKGARLKSFSCDLSTTCCKGLQEGDQLANKDQNKLKEDMKGGKKIQVELKTDLIGTCGRADQVALFKCMVDTLPKIAPANKEKQTEKEVKICANVAVKTGTDGSGTCSFPGKDTKIDIDGVSTGCCSAVKSLAEAAVQMKGGGKGGKEAAKAAACGMIGACGKTDQQNIMKEVEKNIQKIKGKVKEMEKNIQKIEGKGKGKGSNNSNNHTNNHTGKGGGELELLEMFSQTDGGAQQMMATLMTIATKDDVAEDDIAEDDVAEDDVTEDGSQIVTGLLGFVAGATVTGLGVAALRRRPSSQDEYDEIVA